MHKIHVHFMGIGGSGIAPIAMLAKAAGFVVSGCDYQETNYEETLLHHDVNFSIGHDVSHLEDVDILAVSPAIFDINPDHPELLEGLRREIVMTWQEFMGLYLQKDKKVISIAGTHGKSTTTILAGLTLEAGGLDPSVQAGTIYRPWDAGCRIGESNYFVGEADEFNCNFLNYSPDIAIINNIEMDHPEFFETFEDFKEAFRKFIMRIKEGGLLIVNEESRGIQEVLGDMKDWIKDQEIRLVGYYLNKSFDFPFDKEYKGQIISYDADGMVFHVKSEDIDDIVKLGILGDYNVSNSLGVLSAALYLGISKEEIKDAFKNYKGVGRRSELKANIRGIKVYDDYGHHPTAISAVIDNFKKMYHDHKIYAIIEPHQISRLKMFPDEYLQAFSKADETIVTKSYMGREIHKHLEPIDLQAMVDKVSNHNAVYIECFEKLVEHIADKLVPGDIVIVFGAGKSYQITQKLIDLLNSKYRH
ncbi:UDP-N-acetylmuramate--L-alanine ligase [Acidaminobacter sp. JC074]|uniref:UDP-N-acetylmuramate--L-alanine ligase n=1 Tax=Acidaminobacter sp. JC074 TaxID=2530199 RepID=UPI001F0F0DCF|nr:UDP-N-acetylmuramate--L-alanine ligase [Acidaminobacter sp. JC074]MCH4886207.1 UDP-N-acetylmuramate--L-alanine ligase [Acidaminobacter sp. JC074]